MTQSRGQMWEVELSINRESCMYHENEANHGYLCRPNVAFWRSSEIQFFLHPPRDKGFKGLQRVI